MTTLHINCLLLALMLFIIQLAIIFVPVSGFSPYQPLLPHMVTGNGNSALEIEEFFMAAGLFSPMGGLIATMKWFAGIKPDGKESE